MTAYDNDQRVRHSHGIYVVNEEWSVEERGSLWDAWPFPECADPAFDDQAYMQQHLRGKGAPTADEAIRSLIGDPQ